jgi:hypothetical protein
MRTLTIRISEDNHARLRNLAKAKGVSIDRLMDELVTVALAGYDSEIRFKAMAARGSKKTGLALLDRLDSSLAAR